LHPSGRCGEKAAAIIAKDLASAHAKEAGVDAMPKREVLAPAMDNIARFRVNRFEA